ncbi:DUF614 domain protein [Aspergillus melleus]|uniref:DUF614 domain protein n=1 Tax=Aspergillus melleus TaxID=138277 RepID=UPI001E8C9D63|nr:uncharacterized protein LDX57_003002 [Aspergillus melleus]KAH8425246.1 hypothetical protein LDX57_003002 [Aspergillus melleus]
MARRLHLDTSNLGANQRYSFLETPLEMQTAGLQIPPQPPQPATVPETHATQQEQAPSEQAQLPLNEKSHPLPEGSDPSHYPNGPNIDHHPAIYAPFADETPQPEQHPDAVVPDYSYVVPPGSPGPLPIKTNPAAPEQYSERLPVAVVPDANPLQTPQMPRFPPPVASGAPQSAADGSMVYHQPGQVAHPNQAVKGGTWSHSLCDCSNIWTCCLGLICPCILYGKTQYRLSLLSRKEDPTNMLGYETCNGSCTAMALLCGCQWLLATVQHTRTRKAYGIRGDIASDCVRATCCTCCTLIQDETEIKKREEERGKAARATGTSLASPYLPPVQMSYGPPHGNRPIAYT